MDADRKTHLQIQALFSLISAQKALMLALADELGRSGTLDQPSLAHQLRLVIQEVGETGYKMGWAQDMRNIVKLLEGPSGPQGSSRKPR